MELMVLHSSDSARVSRRCGLQGWSEGRVWEIGYSMLEADQRSGYCTEAVRVLVGCALQNRTVRVVVAHTLPGLTPSIRVLEKCGFVLVGDGPVEDGMRTIRYEVIPGQFRSLASQRA